MYIALQVRPRQVEATGSSWRCSKILSLSSVGMVTMFGGGCSTWLALSLVSSASIRPLDYIRDIGLTCHRDAVGGHALDLGAHR